MCRQLSLMVVVAAALAFVLVPLDGASLHSTGVASTSTPSYGQENVVEGNATLGENVTVSFDEDVSLSASQVDRKLTSATDSDDDVQSRARRCVEINIETVQLDSQNLHARSLCPWTYSYNTDPDRIPRTLIEAQCSHMSVGNLAGQCEHVYYHVPVRQNVSGTWTDRWIRLRVGCTLTNPIVAPPRPITPPVTYD